MALRVAILEQSVAWAAAALVAVSLSVAMARAADEGPPPAKADAAHRVDLRPAFDRWGLPVKKQGARGTCSVFTMLGAMEYALSRQRGRGVSLSAEFLNWACNQVIGNTTADRGQFFSDLWRGFERYGVCFEREMPYAPRFDPQLQPSRRALRSAQAIRRAGLTMHWIKPNDGTVGVTDEHLEQVREVLRNGWPVCAGSYHSVLLVGYEDDPGLPGGGTFFVRDSGGGNETALTYADAKARLCDILWIEAPLKGRRR